jgi:hypothetical protein
MQSQSEEKEEEILNCDFYEFINDDMNVGKSWMTP